MFFSFCARLLLALVGRARAFRPLQSSNTMTYLSAIIYFDSKTHFLNLKNLPLLDTNNLNATALKL